MSLDLDGLPLERTLGVQWDVESDNFTFDIRAKDKPLTRRGILSIVSSLYDPLGFLGPFVLTAKIILQDVCSLGIGWDERVPSEVADKWGKWLADLRVVSGVKIPRCFRSRGLTNIVEVQLHTFADASERGYAAVSYLRMVDSEGNIHCSFVIGKTRLSPLKVVSIPRLELTAAVLAVQLSQTVQEELQVGVMQVMFWTDSTSVLQYIHNESRRFHTFVANRVSKIRSATEPWQWHHVGSASNPADEGSRGLTAMEMVGSCQWLKGPDFLWAKEDQWPAQPIIKGGMGSQGELVGLEGDPEVKRSAQVAHVDSSPVKGFKDFVSWYSSWNKLRRGAAWLIRCMKHLQSRCKGNSGAEFKGGPLTLLEIQEAEHAILRSVQGEAFSRVLSQLKGSQQLNGWKDPEVAKFLKLKPILVEGIMRVGGRLRHAPVSDEVKHPIILPNHHHVTNLVVRHYHALVGHSGSGTTWASLRQRFWILQGGVAVCRGIGNCFKCKMRNAPLGEQIMADLPPARVTPEHPPLPSPGWIILAAVM